MSRRKVPKAPGTSELPPDAQPRAVVGLGASAGGLEALQAFFGAIPAHSGAAYVVVQHLKSDALSMLPEILARATAVTVVEAGEHMALRADHVYVLPPGHGLTLAHGTLVRAPRVTTGMKPIDRFFRALGRDQGERAVGIVLSGTATDGTLGLKTIKEQGGLLIAQDPATAMQPSMPQSAIEMGLVDAVLPPDAMPGLVLQYAQNLGRIGPAAEAPLQRILKRIRTQTQHDFRQYKPGTLVRRIHRRMGLKSLADLEAYEALLGQDPEELAQLHQDLMIGVTRFFRDTEAFEALQAEVLTPLVAAYDPKAPLRIWVPACSTGEEAYSIAIALTEAAERLGASVTFKIFATDIDKRALAVARRG